MFKGRRQKGREKLKKLFLKFGFKLLSPSGQIIIKFFTCLLFLHFSLPFFFPFSFPSRLYFLAIHKMFDSWRGFKNPEPLPYAAIIHYNIRSEFEIFINPEYSRKHFEIHLNYLELRRAFIKARVLKPSVVAQIAAMDCLYLEYLLCASFETDSPPIPPEICVKLIRDLLNLRQRQSLDRLPLNFGDILSDFYLIYKPAAWLEFLEAINVKI